MDLQLPGIDGLQTTKEIRGREQAGGPRTPIIALTAHGTAADGERCLASGMDHFVSKPLNPRALFETIERFRPNSSTAPSSVAGISPADPTLEDRLAKLFVQHAPRLLETCRAALDRADPTGVAVAAHTLKGSVGNLPARKAFDAVEHLEMLAREGDLGKLRIAYAAAEREIADLLRALRVAS